MELPPDACIVLGLTHMEIRALTAAACAADNFEPFVGRLLDKNTLERMVGMGLVEAGPSCRPSVGKIGYRLTTKGQQCWKQRKG
jgi:hypothetical protein